ncbi:MAG: PAS domain S-box protein [Akkermansiaceae bacterium]|nr:PAS domain S-box protein [Verrucomicrobiales bacterium]
MKPFPPTDSPALSDRPEPASGLSLDEAAESRPRKAQLQFISDYAPAMLAHCSRDEKYLFVNRAYARHYGLQPGNMIGRSVAEWLSPETYQSIRPHIQSVLAGKPVEFEIRMNFRTRGPRIASVSYVPECDDAGVVQGWLCSITDVTELRAALEESSRGRTHLELALQAGHCGTCEWNLKTGTLEWSGEHFKILGYEPFAFKPTFEHWINRIHPDDRPGVRQELAEAQKERRATRMEHRILLPSGETRWVDSRGRFQFDAEGQAVSLHGIVTDVSRSKRAEEALRESENRYRTLIEQASDGILILNAEGRIVMANSAGCQMLGYAPEELVGIHLRETYSPEDAPLADERLRQLLGGKALRVERKMRRKDGSYFEAEASIKMLPGQLIHGIIRDVTERNKAEQELRRSEKVYRAIGESIDYGIWICDAQGRNNYASESFLKLVGVNQDECAGFNWASVLHPDDSQETIAAWQQCVATGAIWEREHRVKGVDGQWHSILARGVPIRDDHGQVECWAGINLDITSLKRAEQALRDSEERFRKLASHAPVGIFQTDAAGNCQFVNESWCALSGQTPESASGQGWLAALHPEDRTRVAREWRAAIELGLPFSSEYRFQRPDETVVWLKGTAVQLRDRQDARTGYIGTVADITDRKAAETALELRVAERTASLREVVAQMEEFSYSVSHDLRAPLRAIQGYAEALVSDHADQLDEPGREYLGRIVRSGARMDRLILDILTYSRLSRREVQLQTVAMDKLVREIAHQYVGATRPPAQITILDPLLNVMGHEPSIIQAVSNLLSNAIKFVGPGTVPRIRIWSESRDGQVRLWIEDNGIGIQAEHQARLFGLFERIHPETKYEGTGIGLAIVRKAVERMGGTAGLDSNGKDGSRFWLQLPAADNHE